MHIGIARCSLGCFVLNLSPQTKAIGAAERDASWNSPPHTKAIGAAERYACREPNRVINLIPGSLSSSSIRTATLGVGRFEDNGKRQREWQVRLSLDGSHLMQAGGAFDRLFMRTNYRPRTFLGCCSRSQRRDCGMQHGQFRIDSLLLHSIAAMICEMLHG